MSLFPLCLSVIWDLLLSDAVHRNMRGSMWSWLIWHRSLRCVCLYVSNDGYIVMYRLKNRHLCGKSANVDVEYWVNIHMGHTKPTWLKHSWDTLTHRWEVTCWPNRGEDAHRSAWSKEWSCMTCTLVEAWSLTFPPLMNESQPDAKSDLTAFVPLMAAKLSADFYWHPSWYSFIFTVKISFWLLYGWSQLNHSKFWWKVKKNCTYWSRDITDACNSLLTASTKWKHRVWN